MPHYRLSFTGANLMPLECKAIASQYATTSDWDVVSKKSLSNNLLGKARSSTAIRQNRELITRLKNLDPILVRAIPQVRPLVAARLCFLSVLKTYELITDFMIEVVAAKWVERKDTLRNADFSDFYESKSISHPELNNVAESTRTKLRQVMFYMLVQAGYLESAKSGAIIPVQPDSELEHLIKNESSLYQRCLGV
jgi:hypothetical protein